MHRSLTRRVAARISASLLGLCCAAPLWASEPSLPEPLYTLEHEFAIPFLVEAIDGAGAVGHALLYVSADQGKTWNFCDTQHAADGNFLFRAPFEGEFWFIVRQSSNGQPKPIDGVAAPELRVMVGPRRAPQQVAAEVPISKVPTAVVPRHVNSKLFELDYGVASLGDALSEPVAVRRVELWWTGDGGTSWQCYGTDSDCKSPMQVSVDADGLYGLWLVVKDDSAMTEAPPQAGEAPQLWVAVDTVAPEAKLTAAEVIADTQGDELLLRWEANDAQLTTHPITIEYGPGPQGPWKALGAVKGNPGEYHCQIAGLDAALSMPLHFKLSATDVAGNVKTFVTGEPLVLPPEVADASVRSAISAMAHGARWYQVLR